MLFPKSALLVFAFFILAVFPAIGKSPPVPKPSSTSSSSEQHVPSKVETSSQKKPDWMNPHATGPPVNPHELKYNAVGQILESMNVPNSLAQLLFNTTEGVSYEDILINGKHFKPRVDGDDEYACVNLCGDEMSNSSIAKPANISGFCSQIEVAEECIDKCTQPNKLWARYIHKYLESSKDVVCMGEEKIQAFMEDNQNGAVQCADDVAGDNVKFFKGMKHIIDLYLKFEEAEDNKDACYELKYNAIDSSFGMLRDMCEKKIDERLWQLGKSTVVIVLTIFSDGHLLDECPLLYSH